MPDATLTLSFYSKDLPPETVGGGAKKMVGDFSCALLSGWHYWDGTVGSGEQLWMEMTADLPEHYAILYGVGEGPVVGIGPNCTRWMSERMLSLAEQLEIPSQVEVMSGHSGTNAWPLQISREGVATAVLSLPLRYMHTPVEVCAKKDLTDTAKLLAAFVESLGKEGAQA